MATNNWIYLSYNLSDKISGYGNGDRIQIEKTGEICCGANANGTKFAMPTHFGTHIDFPYHFGDEGKKGDVFPAEYFISNKVGFLRITPASFLITVEELSVVEKLEADIEFLFVDTGFWKKRDHDDYWSKNPGFSPEVASFLREKFSKLRILGFDSISMNPWEDRPTGRIAHKEFLLKNDICLLEDVDFSNLDDCNFIDEAIISPLRFENADGAPCTVFAKVR